MSAVTPEAVIAAVRRGRWPVVCWTKDSDPWALTSPLSREDAERLIDLQHRREISAVLSTYVVVPP